MGTRISVGTDVAAIGVWDESESGNVLPFKSARDHRNHLESDAAEGRLFLIQLGGDWGGFVDVYVGADASIAHEKLLDPVTQAFLVKSPTGRLVFGGAEDYRSDQHRITSAESVVTLPPGDYEVRCYVGQAHSSETSPESDEHQKLKSAVGQSEYEYYNAVNRRGAYGFLLLLLFPVGLIFVPWWASLIATVAVFLGFFHVREWRNNQNARYQKVARVHESLLQEAEANSPPAFAFKLCSLAPGHNLTGGILDYEAIAK